MWLTATDYAQPQQSQAPGWHRASDALFACVNPICFLELCCYGFATREPSPRPLRLHEPSAALDRASPASLLPWVPGLSLSRGESSRVSRGIHRMPGPATVSHSSPSQLISRRTGRIASLCLYRAAAVSGWFCAKPGETKRRIGASTRNSSVGAKLRLFRAE